MSKPKAVYLLKDDAFTLIYGKDEQDAINRLVDIPSEPTDLSTVSDSDLAEVEFVFSGWGSPVYDKALLDRLPQLKAIFYGAGSVKGVVTDEVWKRGIHVTSSYVANGQPVAEYTFAQIILSLKRAWACALDLKKNQNWGFRPGIPGCYFGSKVGIVSLGAIGKMVCERLKMLDVEVYAYDPFVSDEAMRELGVQKASLPELFETCEVISLHAPRLEETLKMIKKEHFRSMPKGGTFINTSRGAVVDEEGMIQVLQERPDLFAILDVTDPEPPAAGSPLYSLPNVVLTPHIAGSMGRECRRMGRLAMEECSLFLKGKPAKVPITEENFMRLA